ncbi:hypothetical protein MICRO8M_50171 [Microbacterium sp. 8M]|nr:hypothetical protein MICRO8M_50171 [Microbacterium sp. 8M]
MRRYGDSDGSVCASRGSELTGSIVSAVLPPAAPALLRPRPGPERRRVEHADQKETKFNHAATTEHCASQQTVSLAK